MVAAAAAASCATPPVEHADPAYGAFEEDLRGSLTPGKLADITVLSKNILAVPDEEIRSTEVVYTIVGGRVMYHR